MKSPGWAALLSVVLASCTGVLAAQEQAAPNSVEQLRVIARNNIITLPVELGRLPSQAFVLDSGASSVIVNERIVRERGLSMGEAQTAGAAASDSCRVHLFPETGVSVAGVHLQTQALVAPLQPLETFLNSEINGVAGGQLFLNYAIAMSFKERKASVLPGTVSIESADTVIPLRSRGNLCCILEAEIRIGNTWARGSFLVDTGALPFEVVLSSALAQRTGLLPKAASEPIRLPTFCAESSLVQVSQHASVLLTRAKSTQLRMGDVVVFAGLDHEGSLAGRDFDGVIGSEILRKLGRVVVFDAPHHRLVFRRSNYDANLNGCD